MSDTPTPPEEMPPTKDHPDGEADVTDQIFSEDLEQLKTRMATVEQERTQFKDLLQRTRADFENYQKRILRDQAQERLYAQKPLATDLLPAFDNLERSVQAAQQAGESGPLAQGVEMVLTQLLDVFKRHAITRIEAEGKPFDPNLHQAVMQQGTAGVKPNTVLQVLEQGFLLHDRVLRPARVIVSKTPESPTV